MDQGIHNQQHHWWLDGSEMAKIFQGTSPSSSGGELVTTDQPPAGTPFVFRPERPEEFSLA